MVGINFQVVQVGHGQNMSKCQIPQETDFGWPQRCFFRALINYSNFSTPPAQGAIPRLLWSHCQALQRSATCNCQIHKRVPFQKKIKPALSPAKQKNEFSMSKHRCCDRFPKKVRKRSESCTDDDINPQAVGKRHRDHNNGLFKEGHSDMIHWQVYIYRSLNHYMIRYDQTCLYEIIWIYSIMFPCSVTKLLSLLRCLLANCSGGSFLRELTHMA